MPQNMFCCGIRVSPHSCPLHHVFLRLRFGCHGFPQGCSGDVKHKYFFIETKKESLCNYDTKLVYHKLHGWYIPWLNCHMTMYSSTLVIKPLQKPTSLLYTRGHTHCKKHFTQSLLCD